MADISITAASVVAGANASTQSGTAGETIAAGKLVYLDSTARKFKLADSNSATVEARTPLGVALNTASLDQPLVIQKAGLITIGGTLTAGLAYYMSDTPGGMCPVADVGAGEYATILGIATSTTVLDLDIQASGVAL
jgi:hypothetical protein